MRHCVLAAGAALMLATAAFGQAAFPMVFVPNNGNLEGGVSTFRVNEDGTLTFLQKYVTGSREPNGPYVDGTNAYAVDLSPSGRFVALTHATGLSSEVLSVFRINGDGTLTPFGTFPIADGCLDMAWFEEDYIAITAAATGGGNAIGTYRFNEENATLTRIDLELTGCFTSGVAVTPDRQYLYGTDTCGGFYVLRIESNRSLSRVNIIGGGGGYTLSPTWSPDGEFLYTMTGASSIGPLVRQWSIDPSNGIPIQSAASPYFSGGDSPKSIAFTSDGLWAFVGHGRDATIWQHARDPESGALSLSNLAYDVGQQGSLGGMAAARVHGMEMLFFMDDETTDGTPRGLFSARVEPNGAFTVLSTRVDAQGIWNENIAVWPGPGPAPCGNPDFNEDGGTDIFDVQAFLEAFAGTGPGEADFNRDGGVDIFDVDAFFRVFGGGEC